MWLPSMTVIAHVPLASVVPPTFETATNLPVKSPVVEPTVSRMAPEPLLAAPLMAVTTPKVPFAPVALAPELLKVIEALTSGVSPKSRVWVRVSAPCANRSYLNPCLSRMPNDGGIQG